jgi:uncharacterized delta-60 repeat protein
MLKALKIVFAVVLLLFLVGPEFAQTVHSASVDTAWVKRYNGEANSLDGGSAIAVDHAGHVYVAGFTTSSGTSEDYLTIKYDSNGDTAWVRKYNGTANSWDRANAIAIDNAGQAYVTGYSYANGALYDYVTIKYHLNGDTAWVRRYGLTSIDYAVAIAVDDSGNVYVTGYSYGIGTDKDYATIKYYPNGDTAWVRRFNGPGNGEDWARALAVDGSGNVYVTGRSTGSGTGLDYATVKYEPNGDTAWVRRYNGPGNQGDVATAIAVDGSDYVYVTGYSRDSVTSNDYATIKYKPNGDTAWVRRYNGTYNHVDNANAIAVDGSGNVYVTGLSNESGVASYYATIKYASNGDTLWLRRYIGPGNNNDEARALALDGSGNVYVTGYSYGSGHSQDYATIKYDSNGDTAWVARYDGLADSTDSACAIAVDDSGNVYVTGSSIGNGTSEDCATIKYFQSPSAVEDETESSRKPSEFALSQNYPNPFNPATTIKFKVKGSRFKVPVPTTLKIYDILGQKVRTLVDESKFTGDYTVQWDGKNDKGEQLASGVYFYQLKAGEYTYSKKMVLLK